MGGARGRGEWEEEGEERNTGQGVRGRKEVIWGREGRSAGKGRDLLSLSPSLA